MILLSAYESKPVINAGRKDEKTVILDSLAESARIRAAMQKERLPLSEIKRIIYGPAAAEYISSREAFAFEKALKKDKENNSKKNLKEAPEENLKETSKGNRKEDLKNSGISFICEVKKASPSQGVITSDFDYRAIAKDYEEAGADAISVLTEPEYFKGSDRYLTEISRTADIPVLRKDFTIDEYQIYEAKLIGADAVLLICTLLENKVLKAYLNICDELGLSAIVEAHTKEEVISAVSAGARIIGVNNRNLKTFEVDLNNSIKLRHLVPEDIIFVAESGIKTPEDVSLLSRAGVNAALIGETLMKSSDKRKMLEYLQSSVNSLAKTCD